MNPREIANTLADAGLEVPIDVEYAAGIDEAVSVHSIAGKSSATSEVLESIRARAVAPADLVDRLRSAIVEQALEQQVRSLASGVVDEAQRAARAVAAAAVREHGDEYVEAIRPWFDDAVATVRRNLEPVKSRGMEGSRNYRTAFTIVEGPELDAAVAQLNLVASVRSMLASCGYGSKMHATWWARDVNRQGLVDASTVCGPVDRRGHAIVDLLVWNCAVAVNDAAGSTAREQTIRTKGKAAKHPQLASS